MNAADAIEFSQIGIAYRTYGGRTFYTSLSVDKDRKGLVSRIAASDFMAEGLRLDEIYTMPNVGPFEDWESIDPCPLTELARVAPETSDEVAFA